VFIFGVWVCALFQEKPHNVDMALKRRLVQRRTAVFVLGVWVGAFFQQLFHAPHIALVGGDTEL
jgi:hypothetical protein